MKRAASSRPWRAAWQAVARSPELRPVLVVYAVLGGVLAAFPVVGILHVEASAVVAFAAFFAAGTAAVGAFERGAAPAAVLRRQAAALLVPWAWLTLSLLWRPNCDYARGLLFYLLFPGVTVVLAVAAAYALSGGRRGGRWALVAGGLLVAVLGPLYDVGLHPQFYTYNHVFGGVLGPIYDEELALRPGLLVFRAQTLLWALLLYVAGRRRRGHRAGWLAPAGLAAVLGIGLVYAFSAPLGVNTPAWYLQRALGGVVRTAHFDVYFDPDAVTRDEVAWLAADHEYHYARLAALLDEEVEGRIQSYVYPDADAKARLTGARATNVAPVWLADPQTHVLRSAYGRVFPHELAHVFAREFGLSVLRATFSVGLVEGLAVALEPPDGLPTPHEQVAVARRQRIGYEHGGGGLADELAARLSPLGFWGGRGAVSYTTMGSFVRYLLDGYGPEKLKAVYARADFARVYGKPAAVLAAEWEAYLAALPWLPRAAEALVARRFTVPSLFETPCPHYVPPYRRQTRAAEDALAAGDTTRAAARVDAALALEPRYAPALDLWARLHLAAGEAAVVAQRLDTLAAALGSPVLLLRRGDALALQGRAAAARTAYDAAWDRLPLYAEESRALVALRRALADEPDVLAVLTSGRPAAVQAALLARRAGASAAARWMQALRWAEAGAHRAAAELMASAALPSNALPAHGQRLLQRQRAAWRARFLLVGGDLLAAERVAAAAAAERRAAGDFNEAARLAATARQARWMLTHRGGVGWTGAPRASVPTNPHPL